MLSEDIRVYDVVSDELRYGIVIPKIERVTELLQLAVDHTSGHFAISLPVDHFSSVGIFDPEDSEPLMVRSIPHRIVSLVSSPDASGFIALDDAAQVWVISEGSGSVSAGLATAQPLQDLNLDDIDIDINENVDIELVEDEDADMVSDDGIEDGAENTDAMDIEHIDDDFHPVVVPQQHLADIFDATPAFAAPSVEDMFYKVTGLLATKPLAA